MSTSDEVVNKNTIKFNTNITTHNDRVTFTPIVGDELFFCDDEEVAVRSYLAFVGCFNIEITKEFLTDFFELKEIKGTMCNPIYIGEKKYGFFGCRYIPTKDFMPKIEEGRFFLYKME